VQRFEEIRGYRADSWPHPRRIVAKIEVTAQGSQRRFVVTNLDGPPEALDRAFHVQRGAVPEQPIGELKNGLCADRLSACGFSANAFRLLVHTLAYAIVVLFREAVAALPELAVASVSTLRQRLWKVGAVVQTSARQVWFRLSETWPYRGLWGRVQSAVQAFVDQLGSAPRPVGALAQGPQVASRGPHLLRDQENGRRYRRQRDAFFQLLDRGPVRGPEGRGQAQLFQRVVEHGTSSLT
jgi:hypothetical protein